MGIEWFEVGGKQKRQRPSDRLNPQILTSQELVAFLTDTDTAYQETRERVISLTSENVRAT